MSMRVSGFVLAAVLSLLGLGCHHYPPGEEPDECAPLFEYKDGTVTDGSEFLGKAIAEGITFSKSKSKQKPKPNPKPSTPTPPPTPEPEEPWVCQCETTCPLIWPTTCSESERVRNIEFDCNWTIICDGQEVFCSLQGWQPTCEACEG